MPIPMHKRIYHIVSYGLKTKRPAIEITDSIMESIRPGYKKGKQGRKRTMIHPLTKEQKAARRAESLARIRAILESK